MNRSTEFGFPCICGATAAGRRVVFGRSRRNGVVDVRRCAGCGLARTFPGPSVRSLRATVYASEEDFQPQIRFAARLRGEQILAPLREAVPHGRTLLDVGCGIGTLLVQARDAGWSVRGLELNERAAAYGRSTYGLSIDIGAVEALAASDGRAGYDAITLSHVLEHLEKPHESIGILLRALNPGGALAVLVPNMDGLYARILRAWWYGYAVEQHLWHFTPGTIGAVARAAGARLESVSTRACLDYPVPAFARPLVDLAGTALGAGDLMLAVFRPRTPAALDAASVDLDAVSAT